MGMESDNNETKDLEKEVAIDENAKLFCSTDTIYTRLGCITLNKKFYTIFMNDESKKMFKREVLGFKTHDSMNNEIRTPIYGEMTPFN